MFKSHKLGRYRSSGEESSHYSGNALSIQSELVTRRAARISMLAEDVESFAKVNSEETGLVE